MNPTVLIAEDDTKILDLFQEFLLFQGYQVQKASDALDCVKKLRHLKPNVLLLDPRIHWKNCDSILSWLRKECDKDGVPMILVDKDSFSPHVTPSDDLFCEEKQVIPSTALTTLEERIRMAIACKGHREPDNVKNYSD